MAPARVSSLADLIDALATDDDIVVDCALSRVPSITLRPGVSLRGGMLRCSGKGIRLTSGNRLEDITIIAPDTEVAIANDTSVASLGRMVLRNVRARGQVMLLADDAVREGRVDVERLTVLSADVRGRADRPHGFGVDVLQGAFTLWNRQADPAVRVRATLNGISVGSAAFPARGSGVFVAGHGDPAGRASGGRIDADLLRTGPVVTDGGIEPGAADLISGGIFVGSGAEIGTVVNDGAVTTIGPNDMVLDNWGEVGSWTARGPVTSHGPSGIGFVNFGVLNQLDVQAPVQTLGAGARGFNVYDGHLSSARFNSIMTRGDGAIGIQVSKDLPLLEIHGDVSTVGGQGLSLVRGEQVTLRAIAISVKQGGRIGRLRVGGSVSTTGENVVTLEVAGSIDELRVADGITAWGEGSDAVLLTGTADGLDQVRITAVHGRTIVREDP